MPNGGPRDGFFYPSLTLMIDSYDLTHSVPPRWMGEKGLAACRKASDVDVILK